MGQKKNSALSRFFSSLQAPDDQAPDASAPPPGSPVSDIQGTAAPASGPGIQLVDQELPPPPMREQQPPREDPFTGPFKDGAKERAMTGTFRGDFTDPKSFFKKPEEVTVDPGP